MTEVPGGAELDLSAEERDPWATVSAGRAAEIIDWPTVDRRKVSRWCDLGWLDSEHAVSGSWRQVKVHSERGVMYMRRRLREGKKPRPDTE